MEGINYLTDEKGEKIAIQLNLKEHKKFIQEYLEFIDDKKDILKAKTEETVLFEEVISKFEKLHGKAI